MLVPCLVIQGRIRRESQLSGFGLLLHEQRHVHVIGHFFDVQMNLEEALLVFGHRQGGHALAKQLAGLDTARSEGLNGRQRRHWNLRRRHGGDVQRRTRRDNNHASTFTTGFATALWCTPPLVLRALGAGGSLRVRSFTVGGVVVQSVACRHLGFVCVVLAVVPGTLADHSQYSDVSLVVGHFLAVHLQAGVLEADVAARGTHTLGGQCLCSELALQLLFEGLDFSSGFLAHRFAFVSDRESSTKASVPGTRKPSFSSSAQAKLEIRWCSRSNRSLDLM